MARYFAKIEVHFYSTDSPDVATSRNYLNNGMVEVNEQDIDLLVKWADTSQYDRIALLLGALGAQRQNPDAR